MAESFKNSAGGSIVTALVKTIQENAKFLSDVDGAIGDGDHGINMRKGFTLAAERLSGKQANLTESLRTLGTVLLTEIGGSMGPLYGTMFREMAKATQDKDEIDAQTFALMLESAETAITSLGGAKVGDKTLMDTLDPATRRFREAVNAHAEFADALDQMSDAAEKGKDSTKDMVAKIGRAARLGERSRGVLDAGATSCWLILKTMSENVASLLGD
jgi:dihydroxyacetone kinase-like protein